jgi:hypothetical protein
LWLQLRRAALDLDCDAPKLGTSTHGNADGRDESSAEAAVRVVSPEMADNSRSAEPRRGQAPHRRCLNHTRGVTAAIGRHARAVPAAGAAQGPRSVVSSLL